MSDPKTITITARQTSTISPETKAVELLVYAGGLLKVPGYPDGVVIDLTGLEFESRIPLLKDHDNHVTTSLGHIKPRIEDNQVRATGVIVAGTPEADRILDMVRAGTPFSTSIGAKPIDPAELVPEGHTRFINGRQFTGPFYHARRARMVEASIVMIGADQEATAKIAAKNHQIESNKLNKGIDTMSQSTNQSANQSTEAVQTKGIQATADDVPEGIQKAEYITNLCGICAGFPSLQRQAIAESWSFEKAELETLRAKESQRVEASAASWTGPKSTHPVGPSAYGRSGGSHNPGKVIEAAVYSLINESEAEKEYDEGTMQRARDIGAHSLMDVIKAACALESRAASGGVNTILAEGFSTVSLPVSLGNVAGKVARNAYGAYPGVIRQICGRISAADFKQSYQVGVDPQLTLEKVGAGGEIKHGTVTEDAKPYQVESFAKMLTLSRQQIINDDLSAFDSVPKMLGRSAAATLEEVGFTLLLSNPSSFFHADNNNLESEALCITGLTAVETMLRNQVGEDGKPIAIRGQYLLVPTALLAMAKQVIHSTELVGTAATPTPNANPHAGSYEILSSPWLSNSSLTGYSATAWYLLGSPGDVPFMNVAFLHGNDQPVIEHAATSFDTLGLSWRCVFDFGVGMGYEKAAVKSAP